MPSADALTDEVVRLYALPADEFTAARNAIVKEWKRAGRKDDAATIAALRKPSVIESAINHTAHRDPSTTSAWADAARAADAAQSATIGGADAADLRAAVAELRTATAALVDAVVLTIGDDARRDDVATLLRAVPVGAVHQVTAGVLGSADRADDDLFAGAPSPPPRARAERRAPDRPAQGRTRAKPGPKPAPEKPRAAPKRVGPSARERELDAAVAKRRAELDAATAARDAAQEELDDATRRLDTATRDRAAAERALTNAEAELRTERATRAG